MPTIQITLDVADGADPTWGDVLAALAYTTPANRDLKVRDGMSDPIDTHMHGFRVRVAMPEGDGPEKWLKYHEVNAQIAREAWASSIGDNNDAAAARAARDKNWHDGAAYAIRQILGQG